MYNQSKNDWFQPENYGLQNSELEITGFIKQEITGSICKYLITKLETTGFNQQNLYSIIPSFFMFQQIVNCINSKRRKATRIQSKTKTQTWQTGLINRLE